jgi:hypothetical protein
MTPDEATALTARNLADVSAIVNEHENFQPEPAADGVPVHGIAFIRDKRREHELERAIREAREKEPGR